MPRVLVRDDQGLRNYSGSLQWPALIPYRLLGSRGATLYVNHVAGILMFASVYRMSFLQESKVSSNIIARRDGPTTDKHDLTVFSAVAPSRFSQATQLADDKQDLQVVMLKGRLLYTDLSS